MAGTALFSTTVRSILYFIVQLSGVILFVSTVYINVRSAHVITFLILDPLNRGLGCWVRIFEIWKFVKTTRDQLNIYETSITCSHLRRSQRTVELFPTADKLLASVLKTLFIISWRSTDRTTVQWTKHSLPCSRNLWSRWHYPCIQ